LCRGLSLYLQGHTHRLLPLWGERKKIARCNRPLCLVAVCVRRAPCNSTPMSCTSACGCSLAAPSRWWWAARARPPPCPLPAPRSPPPPPPPPPLPRRRQASRPPLWWLPLWCPPGLVCPRPSPASLSATANSWLQGLRRLVGALHPWWVCRPGLGPRQWVAQYHQQRQRLRVVHHQPPLLSHGRRLYRRPYGRPWSWLAEGRLTAPRPGPGWPWTRCGRSWGGKGRARLPRAVWCPW
jgi:hypothetical protein